MIAALRGNVLEKSLEEATIDVGGVGYRVFFSSLTLGRLPAEGQPVQVRVRTVVREDGFLVPEIFTSTLLGTGLQTPYFLTFGPHAQAVLTPWLSPDTTTLEGSFRRRFRFGQAAPGLCQG